MQEQAKEEMFPREKRNDPNTPPSWITLEGVIATFAVALILTLIFNGL